MVPYGSPEELPNIKHSREYGKDAPPRPDWRITCIFVDKKQWIVSRKVDPG